MQISHFGDYGDLAAFASCWGQIDGGVDLVLYPSKKARESFSFEKVERVRSFLEAQTYVRSVQYSETPKGFVADGWRDVARQTHYRRNLALYQAEYLGLTVDFSKPWFRVPSPRREAEYVLNLTPRYKGLPNFPWGEYAKKDSVFVGTLAEHQAFERAYGRVRYVPTPTALDFASVIAGAGTAYVGNQSSGFWTALGLGVPRIHLQQAGGKVGNCWCERPGLVFDGSETF